MSRRYEDLPFEEEVLKLQGMNLAARRRAYSLSIAQDIAHRLGGKGDEISIEEVRLAMDESGISYDPGNWMGSVFKSDEWEPVGFKPSNHKGGHCRIVRTWKLKGGKNGK